ncbi:DNA repair protein RadA [Alphaproteobacteria bacterium endosymbiont of Tiliacea citrago]|uniref:DNA repair protein RadA n=1 Tax=Alphaproteobacteria bacterium endosymbiont of Tiliacea citrago TaxID=3077944 RepID=UPI00313E2E2F
MFKCFNCATTHIKWMGKCSNCNEWNSLEEIDLSNEKKNKKAENYFPIFFESLNSDEISVVQRLKSKITEFDRTIGGGLVEGGVILISGDPGIGKSTLLLQISDSNFNGKNVIYVSGEESTSQIKLRAKRLNIEGKTLKLTSLNKLEEILSGIEAEKSATALIIIDSIQTIYSEAIDGNSGSVSQIKYCAQKLIEFAKKEHIAIIIVGHVTKEGAIAGPKILEHNVDTVLYFEGERNYSFRVLRSMKNRFGPTDELGIFEIKENGLKEVLNPSLMFLNQQKKDATGSVIFPNFEGSRPLMLEIQSLVSNSYLQMPRRAVIGWDQNRLPMICAVLEKHCKVSLGNKDVYLTVMSGLKITEPAADLAVLCAILSSHLNVAIPCGLVAFGEIGLSGEIRSVQHSIKRIEESIKLKCKGVLTANISERYEDVIKFSNVKEVLSWFKSL